jgi:heterodisulfide reductase subunit A-like polyferredoxin
VDTLALPDRLTITQVGYSPVGYGESAPIKAGQRAVFFIVATEIAWRDGRRAVLRTTNTVSESILVVGGETTALSPAQEAAKLNGIVQAIAERREIIPDPVSGATGTP